LTDTRLTIAVLPFTSPGDKPGEDWLGDGIAEDIMTAVSRFRDLTVIGRNSSFRYRGDAVDVRQAAKDLGAHYLLQGSVRRSGDRLRITVQLVDPRTGANRWTERYDRPFSDVFAIQDEVANRVAAQLVAHAREAAATRLRAKAPENLEVYELVLRGRKAYRSHTREGAAEARALAERAIAIDPSYAAAWEVLAQALLQFYMQPYSSHQGAAAMLQEARTAAEKAATLDANFATGQATLGFALICARQHEASLVPLSRAIDLNPNDAEGHAHYGQALFFAGRYRDSIKAWEGAERLDPFGPAIWLAFRALPHIMLHEFEPALRLARSCAQRAPKLPTCSIYLAIAARELGLEDDARAAARRVLEIYPGFSIERYMRIVPFGREADAAQWVGYLRRIGLPE
jgi:TolB-like protein